MKIVVPFLLLYFIIHVSAGNNLTATNGEEKCYSEIKKAQHKLDILIKHLDKVSKDAKFPKEDGPGIEKIKIIKDLIQKLRKLSKQDIRALDDVILSNMDQNINISSRLEKIEKRITEYKTKRLRNKKTIMQLENILESLKAIDVNLSTYIKTSKICEEAEDTYNKFTDDVNIIDEMYDYLNDVVNQCRKRNDDLVRDVEQVEAMIDDIKIPQSYISNYLCNKENQLQKIINENFQALGFATYLLEKIIGDDHKFPGEKPEEIIHISDLVHQLNKDLTVVYDILETYEHEIPAKISIEKLEQSDISTLQNDVKDLDEAVSKLLLKSSIQDKNSFFDEYERKLKNLRFLLGDQNIQVVKKEIDLFEKYNLRIQKLINEKEILEVQIEDIKQLVKQMMNQKVCRGTGSEH